MNFGHSVFFVGNEIPNELLSRPDRVTEVSSPNPAIEDPAGAHRAKNIQTVCIYSCAAAQ